jgi:hypothetical protein
MAHDRASALRSLIAYEQPLDPILVALRSHGWDASEPLAILTSADVISILERYLSGDLTAQQVADWADLVECREDIELPQMGTASISDAVFHLANPNLRGELTPQVAERIRSALRSGHGDV